ncbi:glycoside hydrolase, partial [Bacteroides sp. OttesenSCG-928-M17]|nr:glycoside hydrolase [Bacteroides sp. OttesenSCG-928-M17]
SIQEGCLFYINVRYNAKYDKEPGRGVENITFRNITYNGVGENPSLLKGLDAQRMAKNITFENVVINGVKMKDTKEFRTNEFVKGVKVK